MYQTTLSFGPPKASRSRSVKLPSAQKKTCNDDELVVCDSSPSAKKTSFNDELCDSTDEEHSFSARETQLSTCYSSEDENRNHGNKRQRRRSAADRLREERRRRQQLSTLDGSDSKKLASQSDRKATDSKKNPKSKRKKLNKAKRQIFAEDDSDSLDDFIVEDHPSDGDDPKKDNISSKMNSESEEDVIWSDDEIETDGNNDGPMSHAAVSFKLDNNEVENLGITKPLGNREAFAVWLEDLVMQAETHMHDSSLVAPHVSNSIQRKAASQIERPLCTRRESTLGSSAWRGEFYAELKSRPIYRSFEIPQLALPDKVDHCGACGRASHNITHRIELSGPKYDSQRTWESRRDLKHTDWAACLRMMPNDFTNKDKNCKDTISFYVGGHCRARTKLYHALLHYKYHLFDRILGMLDGTESTVDIRMQEKENGQTIDSFLKPKTNTTQRKDGPHDKSNCEHKKEITASSAKKIIENVAFVEREYERSRMLTQDAEENWGSKGEHLKDSFRSKTQTNRNNQNSKANGKRSIVEMSKNNSGLLRQGPPVSRRKQRLQQKKLTETFRSA